jgi:homoserine kinase
MSASQRPGPIYVKLPATSANLGPGFDALGLAMSFYLTIEAELSLTGSFAIDATGRNPELCGSLTKNLILDTYADVLVCAAKPVLPLSLKLHNDIPLGMGCGSSAAALLAGVLLANHFGDLGWTGYEAMEEACRREGHPDNVAACWLGGMAASAMQTADGRTSVLAASCGKDCKWTLMLAIPSVSLATEEARALLPESYSRADAVANVQNAALLVAAFALDRPDLLKTAMRDRMHQPYRSPVCPLLPLLLPLMGEAGVYGVALSGAGPSVLLVIDPDHAEEVRHAVLTLAPGAELITASTSKETEVGYFSDMYS